MPSMYTEESVAEEQYMPNLHQLLEDIKQTDRAIDELRQKRSKMIESYHSEKDKLDAHYAMVLERPEIDPGPTMGRY